MGSHGRIAHGLCGAMPARREIMAETRWEPQPKLMTRFDASAPPGLAAEHPQGSTRSVTAIRSKGAVVISHHNRRPLDRSTTHSSIPRLWTCLGSFPVQHRLHCNAGRRTYADNCFGPADSSLRGLPDRQQRQSTPHSPSNRAIAIPRGHELFLRTPRIHPKELD